MNAPSVLARERQHLVQSVVEPDRDIGELMAVLRVSGQSENTLVIAKADNGPMHEMVPLEPHEVLLAMVEALIWNEASACPSSSLCGKITSQ